MNKICHWRKGEIITHQKLNNTVDVVNEILTNFKSTGTNLSFKDSSSSSQINTNFSSVPYNEFTLTADSADYHSKMWDNDGEAIVLGWDKNRLIEDKPGVYVRNNGIYMPLAFWQAGVEVTGDGQIVQPDFNSTYKRQDCQIKLINCLGGNSIDGSRVWQKIMVNCRTLFEPPPPDPEYPCVIIPCNGYTPDGSTSDLQVKMEIHPPDWTPTWKRWGMGSGGHFYRPMSRITTSCATDVCAQNQWKLEAISTNDTLIWPLPIGQHHANLCVGDIENKRWFQHISTMPDGWTFREKPEGAESCHMAWYSPSQLFLHYSVLSNRGGLKFSDIGLHEAASPTNILYPEIESGIELYGYKRQECGDGQINTILNEGYEFNKCSPVPQLQPGTIACWPIKRRLMYYVPATGFWCCEGTSSAGSIKLNVFKPCNNSWQIGFLTEGCITYEYYAGLKPGGGCGETQVYKTKVVKQYDCNKWLNISCTRSGTTTIYELDVSPYTDNHFCVGINDRQLRPNIPQFNSSLRPYYPILCEHMCEESAIRLCHSFKNNRDVYRPILPQWVLNIKHKTDCLEIYNFDPQWFCINDGNVTLNTTTLATLAEEVASEIKVCVGSSGLADTTSWGKITVNTTGLINLTADQYAACSIARLT